MAAEEMSQMRNVPYHETIGSLMYTALGTCPDNSFSIMLLSQYVQNPGNPHWEAVKHIFWYLKPTKNYELTFGLNNNGLHGYTDADHATQEHHHSISGYAFRMYGGAISWSTKKQPIIALSTTETEYLAATHAAKEAAWICKFLDEINQPLTNPITLLCDNQSAIMLAKDSQYHACTKHISTGYHFICEMVEDCIIALVYCLQPPWLQTHSPNPYLP